MLLSDMQSKAVLYLYVSVFRLLHGVVHLDLRSDSKTGSIARGSRSLEYDLAACVWGSKRVHRSA